MGEIRVQANVGQIRVNNLIIPKLTSTEQAINWGSCLKPKEVETLRTTQKALNDAALAEKNLQRKVTLATQSQLYREALEAAPKL